MPKKIDRKTANELSGLSKQGKLRNKSRKDHGRSEITEQDGKKEILEQDTNKENIDESNIKAVPYVPGDVTEDKYRLPSHDELAANRFPKRNDIELPKGFPNTRDDFSKPLPEPEKDTTKEVEDFYALHKDMLNSEHKSQEKKDSPKESGKDRLLSPILAAISNFNLAKRLHKENLEHNPLPDTITDKTYRKLQMQKDMEPGLSIQNKNYATAIGWKGHSGYAPTRCTKLKVFRPKTCGHIRDLRDDDSISSFDKKWRFIRQTKVTPMDLAICWDLTPEDPKDEPKPPTHIDGSNGSAAPAVFSLIHTPKEEEEGEYKQCDGVHGCAQIFNHGTKEDNLKDFFFDRPKTSGSRSRDSVKSDSNSSKHRAKSANNAKEVDKESLHSKESKASSKTRAKSAYNLHQADKRSTSSNDSNNNMVPKKVHQSTPNLSEADKCSNHNCPRKITQPHRRLCVACELKNVALPDRRPMSDYKMAFKAGVPQKIRTKRQDYPDHWRLATVYQHSYKPIPLRKRPLLQTVFK